MMHCSYQLNQSNVPKKICIKSHVEASLQDILQENLFNLAFKKNFSLCHECPVKRNYCFFHLSS
jgi:hypothetical protein